ncbi:outer membrane protein [Bartonella sp. B30(2025)]
MNMKWVITASTFVIVLASSAQASDVIMHNQPIATYSAYTAVAPTTPIILTPHAFSWSGFYLGGQIGSILGKADMNVIEKKKNTLFNRDFLPKFSGFVGGIYAGSNVDFRNGLVLGVDSDIVWVNKSETKTTATRKIKEGQKEQLTNILKNIGIEIKEEGIEAGDEQLNNFTYKEKWIGATRMRIGFAADRFFPYVAGGVSYMQTHDVAVISIKRKGEKAEDAKPDEDQLIASGTLSNEIKWLVGYTLGGGIDFAVTDNVVMRAEYRYSEFSKKKFVDDKHEVSYKINDFRVGIAYKF